MKNHIVARVTVLMTLAVLISGCITPRETAEAGAFAGRQVGGALGFVATTLDESVKYAEDVVRANPRYDARQRERTSQTPQPTIAGPERRPGSFVQADVVIETDSPTDLRSISMRQSEAGFWKTQDTQ